MKGCFRVLQAEVCEPSVALTRRWYGTVAVMSSVTSHWGLSVREHQLLGIQTWLMYRLSYSLVKESKARCHSSPSDPGSMTAARRCLHSSTPRQSARQAVAAYPACCTVRLHQPSLLLPSPGKGSTRHKPQAVHSPSHFPNLSHHHPLL